VINSSFKKGDKINYADAMPVISIDLETTVLEKEQKWTIRKETESRRQFDG
jgi:hypothetical protein